MRLYLVISLTLTLAACSSSTPTATSPVTESPVATSATTTSTTVAAETTTPIDPEAADRAEIEDVLTRFYALGYEVGFDPEQPGLDEVAIPPLSDHIRESVRVGAAAGYQIGDGDQAIRIIEISVNGDTATGSLCRLDEASITDVDGREIAPFTPDPRVLEFVVRRTQDGWRVSDSTIPPGEDIPCEI